MIHVARGILLAVVLGGGGVLVWAGEPGVPEAGRNEGVLAMPPEAGGRGAEVYRSNFAKEAGAEWSKKAVTKSPSGKHMFLGPLGYESAMLTLDKLPEHGRVRITFDVMVMLTWDGDANLDQPGPTAPDVFDVTVEGGPRLVQASFVCRPSSTNGTQSFPGRFPYDHFPAGTGSVESGTLGYQWGGSIGAGPDDYVYHVERLFAHSGKSLKIAFSGINLEPDGNELWGLENVRVEVLPAGPAAKFDEGTFERHWADLGSEDAKVFAPAIEGMIGLGDGGVAVARRRLRLPAPFPDQGREIGMLIAQLDADAYAVREKASAALRGWGAAAVPALREARGKSTSAEACSRMDALLAHLTGGTTETETERRVRRMVEVLERIGSEEARAGLGEIGKLGGTLGAWEAQAALRRLEGKAEIPTKLDLPPGLPRSAPAGSVAPAPPDIRFFDIQ